MAIWKCIANARKVVCDFTNKISIIFRGILKSVDESIKKAFINRKWGE